MLEQNMVGSRFGFQNLVASSLNIKVSNPSVSKLFLQHLLAKVIIQYKNINYIDFSVDRKK